MIERTYYVGLDIHKKIIAFCVKKSDGEIVDEGKLEATRGVLRDWAESRDYGWIGGMEATLFTGWVYDTLKPYALELKVAHPAMLKAIAASKKKNDKIDARKIADALRADLLPQCYMMPTRMRELRRMMRYRNFVVRLATRLKNKTSGLLMECGVEYDKRKLHGKRYFGRLLADLDDAPVSVLQMLRSNRNVLEILTHIQKEILRRLQKMPDLEQRVLLLRSIDGVGEVLSLTWALEIGDPFRFSSTRKAISYCGLCSALHSSAGKQMRGPISKQRNANLQWVLVEAAHKAPALNEDLARVHAREVDKGNHNRATLAVARKLVSYLLAVDKSGKPFTERRNEAQAA